MRILRKAICASHSQEMVFAEIIELNTEMDHRGIDFCLALMPIFENDKSLLQAPIMNMHTETIATLAENEIPVIDLQGAFEDIDAPSLPYAFDDVHLTEAGHQVVALRLANELP